MKLIFLDIDGTLVPAGTNVIPESAQEAIRKAQANGHKVFLCTGRNVGMAKPVYDFGFDGIIALAGAYVKVGDEIIYDQPMPEEDVTDLLDILHRNGVFCTIEGETETFGDENLGEFLENADGDNSEIERWRQALKGELGIKPMQEYKEGAIYKIVIMCPSSHQLDEARRKYEDRYEFAMQEVKEHGNCINGELIFREFDKGLAIERVCDHYGLTVADTIGFGDSMNDLPMIKKVGVSLVMANGSPTLMSMSNYTVPSVEDDGLKAGFELLGII